MRILLGLISVGNAIALATGDSRDSSKLIQLALREPSGATVYKDSSGKNHKATCPLPQMAGAACPTSGKGDESNPYTHFDGKNQALQVGNLVLSEPADALSVSLWVKANHTGQTNAGLVSQRDENGGSWSFSATDTQVVFWATNSDGKTVSPGIADSSVFDGNWHHLAATHDGKEIALFFDGAPHEKAALSGKIAPSRHPLTIGAWHTPTLGHFFRGSLADIILHTRALKSDEIAKLFWEGRKTRFFREFETPPNGASIIANSLPFYPSLPKLEDR